jgi:hypothetical protein
MSFALFVWELYLLISLWLNQILFAIVWILLDIQFFISPILTFYTRCKTLPRFLIACKNNVVRRETLLNNRRWSWLVANSIFHLAYLACFNGRTRTTTLSKKFAETKFFRSVSIIHDCFLSIRRNV